MKPSEIYKEAFSKAFSVAIKELSNYNCNNLADTMLFSEYMLNRTCSLGDGRVMSQREFYNSVDELPEECKADYNTYQRTTKAIAENLFDECDYNFTEKLNKYNHNTCGSLNKKDYYKHLNDLYNEYFKTKELK